MSKSFIRNQEELTPWRTFSIFISSTFSDMQAERDYLRQFVFPRVEEELLKRRIKLQVVDLRWGVDTTSMELEDEREASVLKVCFDEIKRCRPFFIGLLGDRYGWVPSEARVQHAMAGEKLNLSLKDKSVTALEIEFGVLAGNDQLSRSVFYFRESLPYHEFTPELAAMFSDSYNPDLNKVEKQERIRALDALKNNIKEHFNKKNLPERVKTYRAIWNSSSNKVTGLEEWADSVYRDILEECKSHAETTWDKIPKNWQERELALLDSFIEEHTEAFCGRKNLLDEIKHHLLSQKKENWGMMLTGESGSGKSSVFAMVKKTMDKENCFVLAHSAGLSPRAKNVHDFLQIWIVLLEKELGLKEETIGKIEIKERSALNWEGKPESILKLEIEKIQERFRELLFTLAEKKQIVLLIDAFDRFEPTERARFMTWLPTVLPDNIRLMCTTISGTEEKALTYHNGLFIRNIDYFTEEEAREMLIMLCRKHSKTLPLKIEKIILQKRCDDGQLAVSSPLWLSLAINMLMAMDQNDFEKMKRIEKRGDLQIEAYMAELAASFNPLPGALFLSLVEKSGMVFGNEFTWMIFNYLACSRNGLREKDLEKLLAAETITWDPLRFANLRRWFKNHLILQGMDMQWNMAHNILRTALAQKTEEIRLKNLHGNLADYLLTLMADQLKATETIYHLLQADRNKDAAIFYSGKLTEEEITGSTEVLVQTIADDEQQLKVIASLPGLLFGTPMLLNELSERYIFRLHDTLAIEGNLNKRLLLLKPLDDELDKAYGNKPCDDNFKYNIAALKQRIGIIYKALGKYDETLKYYNKNYELSLQLYTSNPLNESYKNGLTISCAKLGEIYFALGKFDQALEYYNRYYEYAMQLCDNNPQNKDFVFNAAAACEQLGIIYQYKGKFDLALDYIKKDNELSIKLFERNPQNAILKSSLASSYSRLGMIYEEMGLLDQALECFIKNNTLYVQLYENNPKNESIKQDFAINSSQIAAIYQSLGNLDQSLKYAKSNYDLTIQIFESNSQNENNIDGLSISYMRLGLIYLDLKETEKALKHFKQYNELSLRLYNINPLKESHKSNLAISYEKLGQIHRMENQFDQALKYFDEGRILFKELHESNPQNEIHKKGLALIIDELGTIYQKSGKTEQALDYFKESIELSEQLYNSNPQNQSLQNGLAVSYERLGTLYQSTGKTDQALEYFYKYNQLAKQLYDSNNEREILINNLAVSYCKIGEIQEFHGDLKQALECFNKYCELNKKLCEKNHNNEKYQNSYAVSCALIGKIYQSMGDLEKSIEYFVKNCELESQLCEKNPNNNDYKTNLSISYGKLFDIYQSLGRSEQAKEYQDKRLILILDKPQDETQILALAEAYKNIGVKYHEEGNMDLAIKNLNLYYELVKQLFENNPQHVEYMNNFAISCGRIGSLYKSLNDYNQALNYYSKNNQLLSELLENNKDNKNIMFNLSLSFGELGDIYQSMNKFDQALENLNKSYELARQLLMSDTTNNSYIMSLTGSYEKLGGLYQLYGRYNQALDIFLKFCMQFYDLYQSNPENILVLEGLGISYYRLALVYKSTGDHTLGNNYFLQWKNIISYLAKNLPQISKYQQWNEVEY